MATVVIQGTTYTLPVQGTQPPWGEDMSDLISAIVTALTAVSGTGDISRSTFTVANGTASATNVTGLAFDIATIRGATIDYVLFRTSSTTTTVEKGIMLVGYNGTSWDLARGPVTADAGVVFSITNSGQVQYTSTTYGGTGYSGIMVFRAQALTQS